MATLHFLARAAVGLVLTATGPLTAMPASAQPSRSDSDPAASSTWGVIGRNTIGEPNAVFRGGPWARRSPTSLSANVPPPYGIGSLGIIVGSGAEKIAFGNETKFANLPLRDIKVLKYWIYAGHDSLSGISLPIISIEANPMVGAITFTSLNYLPDSSVSPSAPAVRLPNVWQQYDATAAGNKWFATGAAGTAIGCTLATPCTFDVLKAQLPNAFVSFSLGFSKGRDTPFVGAVDGLQVNKVVYDFEQKGVRKVKPKR
jgi:hypothetical protein